MTEHDDTYNGWKNRETWAFNLHWQNDQGLYNETLEEARRWLWSNASSPENDRALGEHIVEHFRDNLIESDRDSWEHVVSILSDIGSFWRIDHAETGAAVRESLDNES